MTRNGVRLETARLLLREPVLTDFDAWAEHMADPEAARFLGGYQPRAVAWRGFMCMAGSWHLQGFGMFSVIEKATGRWVGRVGPWRPEGWPGTEVGWGIIRPCWRRGYALEAASAAIDWAFTTLGWTEVVHCIAPANIPSQALAARLGSRNRGSGRLPPPYDAYPHDIWGQTRAAWEARRAPRSGTMSLHEQRSTDIIVRIETPRPEPEVSIDPSDSTLTEPGATAIQSTLAALSPLTRESFLLNRIDALDHAEIARRLGIPKASVRAHIERALRACVFAAGSPST